MSMNFDTLLSITGAALGFLGLVSALIAMRALRGWRTRCLSLESSLAAVRRELELVASISMKTGRRVKRIEQQYSGVADRVDQVELRGAGQSFEDAIHFARRGADSGRLTRQFGLSSVEADLMARLHGRKLNA